MMGGFGSFGGFGWIGMVLNLIISIAVIIGLILLVVWAVRRFSGSNYQSGIQSPGSQSAKEIAQARYARGEISREEYQQILSDLIH
ncbi:MAG: hypothetical protein CL609_15335 [Anaerolineaceae bacterium]|nr:hypothetical protein [Anaerolineaceae bacterium]